MKSSIIFAASIAVHGAIAFSVTSIGPKKATRESTAISVREQKKKDRAKDTPVPPPIEPPRAPEKKAEARRPVKAKAAPAEPKSEAEPPKSTGASNAAMDALPDFGLSLSGGVGPGGLAVPAGGGGDRHHGDARPAVHKDERATPKPVDECNEPVVKAKAAAVPQPAYTESARAASIEGKLRVEVSVDATGKVTSARVLAGLGHGLDEAALGAARSATFTPATRCGKPVASTFVIAMRFSL